MVINLAQIPVGELVRQRSDRARFFERMGIDYCCGGLKSLAAACLDKGLVLDRITRELVKQTHKKR